METVVSNDGTKIAFDRSGEGPALILVLGAFNDHTAGTGLAEALKSHFTVYNYDRRGKGESGDAPRYTVEREIEDLDALILRAGGRALVFGHSSGAVLALRAAAYGLDITKLGLYEPPPAGARAGDIEPELTEFISAGRRGDAVELFQTEAIGMPAELVARLRNAPFRPALEKIAQTLVYESDILKSLPTGLIPSIRIPTLILYGEKSSGVMWQNAKTLADALPKGRSIQLKGQTHEIVPAVVAPVLKEFFLAK